MKGDILKTRRGFLTLAGTAFMNPFFSGITPGVAKEASHEIGISPVEDLMRERGILNRVLLIYDEALRRMEKGTDIPAEVISGSAGIIRRFTPIRHMMNLQGCPASAKQGYVRWWPFIINCPPR